LELLAVQQHLESRISYPFLRITPCGQLRLCQEDVGGRLRWHRCGACDRIHPAAHHV